MFAQETIFSKLNTNIEKLYKWRSDMILTYTTCLPAIDFSNVILNRF